LTRRSLEKGQHHHLDHHPVDSSRFHAVAFHPDLEYVALESGGQVYIVADALAAATKEKM